MSAFIYALFCGVNVAFFVADHNPISVFGAVFCALMFVARLGDDY